MIFYIKEVKILAEKKPLAGKSLAWLLTLIYFTSYVTRINFSAIIQAVIVDTGHPKDALSIILVLLSVTYGLGQIVNGRLGDIFNPTNLIFSGLLITTVANLLFPLAASSIPMMTVLWAINGFAQAMMWPPIVKILVAKCDEAQYSYAMIRVSWGSSLGTILVYLTAPLIISVFGWKGVMFASAILGGLVAIIWFLLKSRITNDYSAGVVTTPTSKKKLNIPSFTIVPLIFIAFGIIFQGMLKDGITSWTPTYLYEQFNYAASDSIFYTLALAVFSIISFTVVGEIYKRYIKNEVFCASILFALAFISCGVLFAFFNNAGGVFTVAMLSVITGLMHGINLMLISYVPKRFKMYGNISTISGLLNCCSYLGSAIFTYAVPILSKHLNWRYTVGVWGIVAILGAFVCFIAAMLWRKFIFSKGEQ